MPTPERAARPQPRPTPSALSMKDLLASCAAASAVSTPPSDAAETADRDEGSAREDAARRRAA
ncbi:MULTISPECIES: hypothetical protein [Streptomyces]|uniref:hypothetical protein n=1 Tax=Streptomyces TaxID=1883 RepID=UPI0004C945CD|nr:MULTISPECIES: hypothetical protein [Streptomyces]RPK93101.1 hypothetical protein EES46_07325 [Streptomyces sp. ADI98-10]